MARRRSARELLVGTAVGYEIVAALVLVWPFGIVLAPVTWLPATVPLFFQRHPRRFQVATVAAGAWLLFLSAGFAIVGGLLFLPGAVLLLAAASVGADRSWRVGPYCAVAAIPVALIGAVAAGNFVTDRFGPDTALALRLSPGTTEAQADRLLERLLDDPAVAGIAQEGPFRPENLITVRPEFPMSSPQSQDLADRLKEEPLVSSVRPCRC